MPYVVDLPPRPHRGRLSEEEERTYVESLTDEQRTMYQERKETSSVGQRRGRRPRNALEDDVTVSEVQSTAHDVFDGLSVIFQSEADWTDEEFHNIAKGLVTIVNKIPVLRIAFRFLRPISSVVQILRKVKKLMDGRKQQTNTT